MGQKKEESNEEKLEKVEKKVIKGVKILAEVYEPKEDKPRKLDKEAIEVLRDNLFEPEPPMLEVPIPEGKLDGSETRWIKEMANGKQQEKEWKDRESDGYKQDSAPEREAKPELNDPTITHPVQAYSYKMGEIHPLEGMMWGLLERIGFIPVYHAHTVKELSFELGKIYEKYMSKLQEYVENKEK